MTHVYIRTLLLANTLLMQTHIIERPMTMTLDVYVVSSLYTLDIKYTTTTGLRTTTIRSYIV